MDGAASDQVLRYAYLNASLQTGLPNPLDEAITQKPVAGAGAYTKVDEIPYDFVRKRLSVVVADADGSHWLIAKGALEGILSACTQAYSRGQETPLDRDRHSDISKKYEDWSAQGYRVLGWR